MQLEFNRADLVDAGWDFEHIDNDNYLIQKEACDPVRSHMFVVTGHANQVLLDWPDSAPSEFTERVLNPLFKVPHNTH